MGAEIISELDFVAIFIYSLITILNQLSGRRDLNPRPPRPERGALPSCATTRKLAIYKLIDLLAKRKWIYWFNNPAICFRAFT